MLGQGAARRHPGERSPESGNAAPGGQRSAVGAAAAAVAGKTKIVSLGGSPICSQNHTNATAAVIFFFQSSFLQKCCRLCQARGPSPSPAVACGCLFPVALLLLYTQLYVGCGVGVHGAFICSGFVNGHLLKFKNLGDGALMIRTKGISGHRIFFFHRSYYYL